MTTTADLVRELTRFEPGTPCVGRDTVMGAVREAGRTIVTRAEVPHDVVVHIRTIENGKVAAFRHVEATHEAVAFAIPVGVTV